MLWRFKREMMDESARRNNENICECMVCELMESAGNAVEMGIGAMVAMARLGIFLRVGLNLWSLRLLKVYLN